MSVPPWSIVQYHEAGISIMHKIEFLVEEWLCFGMNLMVDLEKGPGIGPRNRA